MRTDSPAIVADVRGFQFNSVSHIESVKQSVSTATPVSHDSKPQNNNNSNKLLNCCLDPKMRALYKFIFDMSTSARLRVSGLLSAIFREEQKISCSRILGHCIQQNGNASKAPTMCVCVCVCVVCECRIETTFPYRYPNPISIQITDHFMQRVDPAHPTVLWKILLDKRGERNPMFRCRHVG